MKFETANLQGNWGSSTTLLPRPKIKEPFIQTNKKHKFLGLFDKKCFLCTIKPIYQQK